jgi:fumarylpyruvate hydrolase
MGSDPDREPPFFFTKPADAVVINGNDMPYPVATKALHHEMELVAAIGTGGSNIPAATALDHVWGYAAGLDMTRRDLQNEAKKTARPWDMSKGFDHSAPIGELAPAAQIGHPAFGQITLKVNGAVRQTSDLSKLIWSVSETIAYLSGLVALGAGDLIFTGTPEGVAAVQRGDRLEGVIEGVGGVHTTIV